MSQPLQLVDEHGEVIRSSCAGCNEHIRAIDTLKRDLELSEQEIRNLRRTVAALRKDKQRERDEYTQRARIEALFETYKRILEKPNCRMGATRFDALRRMVDLGYEDMHFELAFYGAKHAPFTRDGKKFQDLELICRNESKFEDFANRGARAVAARKQQLEAGDE
jgi:hypothetical protein